MYQNVPIRPLGDPITDALSVVSGPVSVSVSPLMLGGFGLMALAVVLSVTRTAATAVGRKGRAVRRALKA